MKYFILIFCIMACAFAPWLNSEKVASIVKNKATEATRANPNLCQLSVHEDTIRRVAFGFKEVVSYDCLATDSTYGIYKGTNDVFITFYQGVIGMPRNTIVK